MTVEQDGAKYEVRFSREHVGRLPNGCKWARVEVAEDYPGGMGAWLAHYRKAGFVLSLRTRCRVMREGQVVSEAHVVLNPHDRPSRFVARKLALTKAIREFPKPERRAFWQAFLRENEIAV